MGIPLNEQKLDGLFIVPSAQNEFMSESEKEDVLGKSFTDILSLLYKEDAKNPKLEITDDFYSNIANIQVNNMDVSIDFFSVPGVNYGGASCIRGIRVHIPHSTAQRIAQILITSLDQAYKSGTLEQYVPMKPQEDKRSS